MNKRNDVPKIVIEREKGKVAQYHVEKPRFDEAGNVYSWERVCTFRGNMKAASAVCGVLRKEQEARERAAKAMENPTSGFGEPDEGKSCCGHNPCQCDDGIGESERAGHLWETLREVKPLETTSRSRIALYLAEAVKDGLIDTDERRLLELHPILCKEAS